MTLAPDPGTYTVGDEVIDGHVHRFVMGTHVLDMETRTGEESLIPGDFPRATDTSDRHQHTIVAVPGMDKMMLCSSDDGHTHTSITKDPE